MNVFTVGPFGVCNFFFLYHNAIMCSTTNEMKAELLLSHFDERVIIQKTMNIFTSGIASGVQKLFFFYGNVAMLAKVDEEKAKALLPHLDGRALDLFSNHVAADCCVTSNASDDHVVKKDFIEESKISKTRKTTFAVLQALQSILRTLLVPFERWIKNLRRRSLMMKQSSACFVTLCLTSQRFSSLSLSVVQSLKNILRGSF